MLSDRAFAKLASYIARASGRPLIFFLAFLLVIAWAVTGPAFRFSDSWQLIVNTLSSIVTFLMVFVIQNTQVRDNAALNAKMDEILRVLDETDKRLIGIERLTDKEIDNLRKLTIPPPRPL